MRSTIYSDRVTWHAHVLGSRNRGHTSTGRLLCSFDCRACIMLAGRTHVQDIQDWRGVCFILLQSSGSLPHPKRSPHVRRIVASVTGVLAPCSTRLLMHLWLLPTKDSIHDTWRLEGPISLNFINGLSQYRVTLDCLVSIGRFLAPRSDPTPCMFRFATLGDPWNTTAQCNRTVPSDSTDWWSSNYGTARVHTIRCSRANLCYLDENPTVGFSWEMIRGCDTSEGHQTEVVGVNLGWMLISLCRSMWREAEQDPTVVARALGVAATCLLCRLTRELVA